MKTRNRMRRWWYSLIGVIVCMSGAVAFAQVPEGYDAFDTLYESDQIKAEALLHRLQVYLKEPRVRAFLMVIADAEGTIKKAYGGYLTHYKEGFFDSFDTHPERIVCGTYKGKPLNASAAGRYMILAKTWKKVRKALRLGDDFGPHHQDLAAVYLLEKCGALRYIRRGRIRDAIAKANIEWATFPNSPHNQVSRTMDQMLAKYNECYQKLLDRDAKKKWRAKVAARKIKTRHGPGTNTVDFYTA